MQLTTSIHRDQVIVLKELLSVYFTESELQPRLRMLGFEAQNGHE